MTSIPFLEMDFSKLPSLYCKAIAMPSILGSINNRVSGSNPEHSRRICIKLFTEGKIERVPIIDNVGRPYFKYWKK